MDICDPVSIILVTAGSRGQSLLFRYPFAPPRQTKQQEKGELDPLRAGCCLLFCVVVVVVMIEQQS